jgi:hypothetical protein
MVLLENFGAKPLTVKLGRSNGSKFVCILRRKVIQTMTLGISKLRKENRPERAKYNKYKFFHTFLGDRN